MVQATNGQRPLKGFFKKFYWILVSITALFFITALWTLISSLMFLSGAERVSGKVVEVAVHTSTGNARHASSTSYTPTFEYVYKGEVTRFSASFGSGTIEWKVDDSVDILVDPSTHEARADYFLEMWFMPLLMTGLGIFFSLFAWVIPKVSRLFSSFPTSGSTQSSTTVEGVDLFDNLESFVEDVAANKYSTDTTVHTDKTNQRKKEE